MESVRGSASSPKQFTARSVLNIPYQMLDAGPVTPGSGSLRSQQQCERAAQVATTALQVRHRLTMSAARELHEVATILSCSSRICEYVSRSTSGLERSVIIRPFGRGYFVLSEKGDIDYEPVQGSFKRRIWATGVNGETGLWSKYAVLIVHEHHDSEGEALKRTFDRAATGALKEDTLAYKIHASRSVEAQYLDDASVEVCTWIEKMQGQDELTVALVKEARVSLDQLIADRRISNMDCLIAYRDAARGLNLMHRNRMVHRDVSPDNILAVLSDDSRVISGKLADFGTVGEVKEQFLVRTKSYYNSEELKQKKWKYHFYDDAHALGQCLLELIGKRRFPYEEQDQLEVLGRLLIQPDVKLRLGADQAAERLDLIIKELQLASCESEEDEQVEMSDASDGSSRKTGDHGFFSDESSEEEPASTDRKSTIEPSTTSSSEGYDEIEDTQLD